MKITKETTMEEILDNHPEMLDFFIGLSPKYSNLSNPFMRKTVAKFATIERIAMVGGIPADVLVIMVEKAINSDMKDDVMKGAEDLVKEAENAVNKVTGIFGEAVLEAEKAFDKATDFVNKSIEEAPDMASKVSVAVSEAANDAAAALNEVAEEVDKVVENVINESPEIINQASEFVNKASETVENIIDEAANEINDRAGLLKSLITDLHNGIPVEILKARFAEIIKDVDASEIAVMEQKLIDEGMPASEIQNLCDFHVQVFKSGLDGKDLPQLPAGHPVHTFLMENLTAQNMIKNIDIAVKKIKEETFPEMKNYLSELLEKFSEIDLHYLRKENQLFPVLEKKGFTGPTSVMWGIHDDIRKTIKNTREMINSLNYQGFIKSAETLIASAGDMIYKEEKILFPTALEMLTDDEWKKVRAGEDEIGYAWIRPGNSWPQKSVSVSEISRDISSQQQGAVDKLRLDTGFMTVEQINAMLRHIPVDISFVDENDKVAYYSDTEHRIFPRSQGVIGREVNKCHPPKSVHIVEKIVEEFKSGRKNEAEFYIELHGRNIHIRYFAVRNNAGKYLGTLEVSQDITDIKKLQGEKRLLDWQ